MNKRHLYVILGYFFLAFLIVPVAYAQTTSDLDFQDIINALGPRQEMPGLLWDILLYLIFLVGIVNLFLIPDKQLFASLLNFLVLALAVVSKLLVGEGRLIEPRDFAVLILNVGIFVIPLILAGMLRSHRGKPPKRLPSILLGLLGGSYFFLFWFLEQRGT